MGRDRKGEGSRPRRTQRGKQHMTEWRREQMRERGMTDIPPVTRWRLMLLHRPRWLHRIIAEIGGYFWLPCPLCQREFGGHEWRYLSQSTPSGDGALGVCPWCAGGPETIKSEAEVRGQWIRSGWPR